jgi:hypothetical protein
MREVSCQLCGRPRRVSSWVYRQGYGKYCSRAHWREAQAAKRVPLTCVRAGCRRRFTVPPSQHWRKHCSRRCVQLAHAPVHFRCQHCHAEKTAPAWRNKRFCDKACAQQARGPYTRRPTLVARNARILELDAQRWRAKEIRRQLVAEHAEWQMQIAMIYQVISRARRQSARLGAGL